MLYVFQILPLRLYLFVGLHLDIGLAPLEAELLVTGNQVVEQQGVGTFLLVFRQETNQHQVETLSLVKLQSLEAMPPSEGEQASVLTLLQRPRHIGD